MIRERYIKEWAARHPWRRAEQVEQDLLLSRVLVAIYSDPFLSERLGNDRVRHDCHSKLPQ